MGPNSAGSRFRIVPTPPAIPRPQALDLRKHLIRCHGLAGASVDVGSIELLRIRRLGFRIPSGALSLLRQADDEPRAAETRSGAYSCPDGGRRSGPRRTQNGTQSFGPGRVLSGHGGSAEKRGMGQTVGTTGHDLVGLVPTPSAHQGRRPRSGHHLSAGRATQSSAPCAASPGRLEPHGRAAGLLVVQVRDRDEHSIRPGRASLRHFDSFALAPAVG